MSSIIGRIAGQSPEDAQALLAELPEGASRNWGTRVMLENWSYTDAKAAGAYLSSVEDPRTRMEMSRQVSQQFARQDLQGAIQWAEGLDDETRKNAFGGIANTWGQQDPKAALEYFSQHQLMNEDGVMVNQVLPRWANQDPGAALEWARSLPEGKLQDRAVSNVIASMADNDPRSAVGMIARLPVEAQDDAAANLAGRWVNRDATAASEWAASLPEGDMKAKAGRNLVENWADRDMNKAVAWINKLPAGGSRDAAVSQFSRQVTDTDPAGAAEWASTISDAGQRDNAMERIFRRWSRRDEAAAQTFLTNTPAVSIELKEKLLAPRK